MNRNIYIKTTIQFIISIIFIQILWMGLEVIYYGKVQPRIVDNYIGIILYISIWLNIKMTYIIRQYKEKEALK